MKNRLNSGRPRWREACKASDSADARKSLLEQRLCSMEQSACKRLRIQLNKGKKNTNKYRDIAQMVYKD